MTSLPDTAKLSADFSKSRVIETVRRTSGECEKKARRRMIWKEEEKVVTYLIQLD